MRKMLKDLRIEQEATTNGWVQANDGLSWCVNGNENLGKHQSISLDGLLKVLLQWIWISCKKTKRGKLT